MPPRPFAPRGTDGGGGEGALSQPAFSEVVLESMRCTIAQRLVEARQTIPHFYLAGDVETDRMLKLREDANAAATKGADGAPVCKISINDFLVKAFALALQAVPTANAAWANDRILRFKHSDIGIAVAVEGGLMTPVLGEAETKSILAIATEARLLADRAPARQLNS